MNIVKIIGTENMAFYQTLIINKTQISIFKLSTHIHKLLSKIQIRFVFILEFHIIHIVSSKFRSHFSSSCRYANCINVKRDRKTPSTPMTIKNSKS